MNPTLEEIVDVGTRDRVITLRIPVGYLVSHPHPRLAIVLWMVRLSWRALWVRS